VLHNRVERRDRADSADRASHQHDAPVEGRLDEAAAALAPEQPQERGQQERGGGDGDGADDPHQVTEERDDAGHSRAACDVERAQQQAGEPAAVVIAHADAAAAAPDGAAHERLERLKRRVRVDLVRAAHVHHHHEARHDAHPEGPIPQRQDDVGAGCGAERPEAGDGHEEVEDAGEDEGGVHAAHHAADGGGVGEGGLDGQGGVVAAVLQRVVGWMDGWLDGWLVGWMVGWVDGRPSEYRMQQLNGLDHVRSTLTKTTAAAGCPAHPSSPRT